MNVQSSSLVVMVGGLLALSSPGFATEARTVDAALAAAGRECVGCDFHLIAARPWKSAPRGLVSMTAGSAADPSGYELIMAYTGSRWARLWAGQMATRNARELPGRIAICMNKGGWTNIRSGPGLDYRRVGKISRPASKTAFEMRLTTAAGKQEGIGWYRISYRGRPAWVQNLRTFQVSGSAAGACHEWQDHQDSFGVRDPS